jgi:hypothetical protein
MNVKGVLLTCVAAFLWVASAIAQPAAPAPLPASITGAQSLVAGQVSAIKAYVAHCMPVLIDTNTSNAASGRLWLFLPLNGQPSPAFLAAYSGEVAAAAQATINAQNGTALKDKPVARMNIMLVLARMPGDDTVPLQLAALSDPLDAVRYWASKGLRLWAEVGTGAADVKTTVAGALKASSGVEQNADVLNQQLLALIFLGNVSSASDAAMFVLDRRAEEHAENPNLSLTPALDGILEQSRSLTKLDVRAPGSVNAEFRLLARVAMKYYNFAQRNLLANDRERVNELMLLIRRSDAALRAAEGALKANAGVPNDLPNLLSNANNWETLAVRAQQWNAALLQKPFTE